MALPMVHLLAADRWAQRHPEYRDSAEFYYGVVSPDAIHVRDGNDKSHKNEIHLNNWGSPHPQDVIDYWRRYRSPFDVGYGVHVLTDGQWVPRFRERLKGMLLPDGRLNTDIYYNDTFVTDFALYHGEERLQALLDMIGRAQTPEAHPLLTRDEFSQWRDTLLRSYRGQCPYHGEVRFVDEAYVRAFVGDSIALIDETFGACF